MPKNRKLNIPGVKRAVMAVVGVVLAFGCALSGIGAQVAAAPTVEFLLGLTEERTRGTSMALALCAAIAGAIGAIAAGVPVDFGIAVVLFVGATVGAILTGRAANNPRLKVVQRIGQSASILLAVYILEQGMRQRIGGVQPFNLGALTAYPTVVALLIGLVAGALSNLLQVASGVFLVPALLFFSARALTAPQAIALSLCVIALASFLPTLSYSSRGAIDRLTGPWLALGGVAGGVAGGWLLGHLRPDSPVPYAVFGLIAMFLGAWRMWRTS